MPSYHGKMWCVCVCVRACMRACMRVCVCAYIRGAIFTLALFALAL